MGGDSDARTDTVIRLHAYSPDPPEKAADFNSSQYLEALLQLLITAVAIGVALILFHVLYRICIACSSGCCACVYRARRSATGTRRGRVAVFVAVLGVVAAVLAGASAESELQHGVTDVGDSLETIGDMMASLQSELYSMSAACDSARIAAGEISCGGVAPESIDDFIDEIDTVTRTVDSLADIFDNIIDPVRDAEDKVRRRGSRWVGLVLPCVVAGPFALYVLLALCGVWRRNCCLNAAATWAGAIGLPVALAVCATLFVASVAMADFCHLGPAAILSDENEDNKYLAYYLECAGTNPLETDVTTLDGAVDDLRASVDKWIGTDACGPTSALDAINDSANSLTASASTITNDILSCAYISPAVRGLLYDALCDRAIEGLYRTWVVLAAAGFACYAALLATPFATGGGGDDQDDDGDFEMKEVPLAVVPAAAVLVSSK